MPDPHCGGARIAGLAGLLAIVAPTPFRAGGFGEEPVQETSRLLELQLTRAANFGSLASISSAESRHLPPAICRARLKPHPFRRALASVRRTWRSEHGAVTAEAVIWMPVMIFLFALVADTALVLGGQARVLRVVQDTNRAVSIGRITNVEDAETQVFSRISRITPNAVVTTTVDSGLITTQVRIPATDLTSVGLVDAFLNLDVTVTAQHLAES
jgi:hypothetical protein